MHFFVTGATGLIGQALVRRFISEGHSVTAWVRDVSRAQGQLGDSCALLPIAPDAAEAAKSLRAALSTVDAVVHLAGEPVAEGRWTVERKRALIQSRVQMGERLARAVADEHVQRTWRDGRSTLALVSASAVGYYGHVPSGEVSETALQGSGFLAELCVKWEAASTPAVDAGVRTAIVRMGVVLARDGGALKKMLPVFRAGLGGTLGDGKQMLPWIHLEDAVSLLSAAATDSRYVGAFNATAPNPESNQAFTRALGAALHRPTLARVPAFALRAAMGEAASILLEGQAAVPRAALALGFRFRFDRIEAALADLL